MTSGNSSYPPIPTPPPHRSAAISIVVFLFPFQRNTGTFMSVASPVLGDVSSYNGCLTTLFLSKFTGDSSFETNAKPLKDEKWRYHTPSPLKYHTHTHRRQRPVRSQVGNAKICRCLARSKNEHSPCVGQRAWAAE